MAKRVTTADLKHYVALCSAKDVVIDGAEIVLARPEVARVWAKIAPTRGSFMVGGFEAGVSRETPTHEITLRYRSDLDISATAWIYEERLAAPPRWFKVLEEVDVDEAGRWTRVKCRLVNRSDEAAAPSSLPGGAVPPPKGVSL